MEAAREHVGVGRRLELVDLPPRRSSPPSPRVPPRGRAAPASAPAIAPSPAPSSLLRSLGEDGAQAGRAGVDVRRAVGAGVQRAEGAAGRAGGVDGDDLPEGRRERDPHRDGVAGLHGDRREAEVRVADGGRRGARPLLSVDVQRRARGDAGVGVDLHERVVDRRDAGRDRERLRDDAARHRLRPSSRGRRLGEAVERARLHLWPLLAGQSRALDADSQSHAAPPGV